MNDIITYVAVFAAFTAAGTAAFPLLFPAEKEEGEIDPAIRKVIAPERLRLLRVAVPAASAAIAILGSLWLELPIPVMAVLAGLLPLASLRLIKAAVNRKLRLRNERFEQEMLDFTILVKNFLRSGFALPAAISMAIRNTTGPVNEEFTTVLREYQLGVDLGDAIKSVMTRVDSENLMLFASSVSISVKTGGSAADVLERIIQTISKRNEIKDKLKTLTAQSEFEALAISLSPLAALVILYLVDPVLMQPMLESRIGWAVMLGIVVWEWVGFVVIKKVISVKI